MKQRFKHNGILLEVTGRLSDGEDCNGCIGQNNAVVSCGILPQCSRDTREDGKDYVWTSVRVVAEKGDGK